MTSVGSLSLVSAYSCLFQSEKIGELRQTVLLVSHASPLAPGFYSVRCTSMRSKHSIWSPGLTSL
jgi:hypothetical protein